MLRSHGLFSSGKIVSPAKHMTFDCVAYVHAVITGVNVENCGVSLSEKSRAAFFG